MSGTRRTAARQAAEAESRENRRVTVKVTRLTAGSTVLAAAIGAAAVILSQAPSDARDTVSSAITIESRAPGSVVPRPTPVLLSLSEPLGEDESVWLATETGPSHYAPQGRPCAANGRNPECEPLYVGSAAGGGITLRVCAFVVEDDSDLVAYANRSTAG